MTWRKGRVYFNTGSNPHTGNTMKPVILKADMNLIDSGKQTVISLKETRAAYVVTVKALRKNSNLDNAFVVEAPERFEGDDRSDIDLYTWDVTYDIFEATECEFTPITWANIPSIDAWISEVAQASNTRNTKEINKIKEPVKVDATSTACIVDTGSNPHTGNTMNTYKITILGSAHVYVEECKDLADAKDTAWCILWDTNACGSTIKICDESGTLITETVYENDILRWTR